MTPFFFARAGRTRAGFEVGGPIFVVTGANEDARASAKQATRQQIAFYGSTPAYRGVLELHGWGEIGDELNAMSKRGQWVEMGNLISDDILETFAVVGDPTDVVPMLRARYGPLVDRISFYTPYALDSDESKAMIAAMKE
jgi:alkanesulfonate monooxygenase SsuD/methylene tetrahydromethanopterin reductase-like flavin-dependent oxidoreductase (luciferase family)